MSGERRVFQFECNCCELIREGGGRGKHRARYFWEGREYVGIEPFAAALGLHKNTLATRLRHGHCLHASSQQLRGEELVVNRSGTALPPQAVAAQDFLRVMARTMRAA